MHWFSPVLNSKLFAQSQSTNFKFELLWTTDNMVFSVKMGDIEVECPTPSFSIF